jgi:hypothetical protein
VGDKLGEGNAAADEKGRVVCPPEGGTAIDLLSAVCLNPYLLHPI